MDREIAYRGARTNSGSFQLGADRTDFDFNITIDGAPTGQYSATFAANARVVGAVDFTIMAPSGSYRMDASLTPMSSSLLAGTVVTVYASLTLNGNGVACATMESEWVLDSGNGGQYRCPPGAASRPDGVMLGCSVRLPQATDTAFGGLSWVVVTVKYRGQIFTKRLSFSIGD